MSAGSPTPASAPTLLPASRASSKEPDTATPAVQEKLAALSLNANADSTSSPTVSQSQNSSLESEPPTGGKDQTAGATEETDTTSSSTQQQKEQNVTATDKEGDDTPIQQQHNTSEATGPGEQMVVLEVLNSYVGRIIGRGGSRIREIEFQTGAAVQLSKPSKPDEHFGPNAMRTVTITGNPDEVERCRAILEDAISVTGDGNPPTISEKNEKKTNYISVPMDRVGRVIGRQGQAIKWLMDQTGCDLALEQDVDGSTDSRIKITGPRSAVTHCERLIIEKISGSDSPSGGRPHQHQPHGHHHQHRSPYLISGSPRQSDEDVLYHVHPGPDLKSVMVRIPLESVGRVIGKRGIHIRQLQEKSGARVHLPKDSIPGYDYREMTISGSQYQVSSCLSMLETMLTPPGTPATRLTHYQNPSHNMMAMIPTMVPTGVTATQYGDGSMVNTQMCYGAAAGTDSSAMSTSHHHQQQHPATAVPVSYNQASAGGYYIQQAGFDPRYAAYDYTAMQAGYTMPTAATHYTSQSVAMHHHQMTAATDPSMYLQHTPPSQAAYQMMSAPNTAPATSSAQQQQQATAIMNAGGQVYQRVGFPTEDMSYMIGQGIISQAQVTSGVMIQSTESPNDLLLIGTQGGIQKCMELLYKALEERAVSMAQNMQQHQPSQQLQQSVLVSQSSHPTQPQTTNEATE